MNLSYIDKKERFKINIVKDKSYKAIENDEICFTHKPYYLDIYRNPFLFFSLNMIPNNGNGIITDKDRKLLKDLENILKSLIYDYIHTTLIFYDLYE